MPNTNDDVLDLDDIVDLNDVVPASPAQTNAKNAYQKPAGFGAKEDVDFGADFDAILQTLRSGETSGSDLVDYPIEPRLPAGSPAPTDGHTVNPDEEIQMPSMADFDALLAELGVPKDEVKPEEDTPPLLANAGSDSDEIDALPLHDETGRAAIASTASDDDDDVIDLDDPADLLIDAALSKGDQDPVQSQSAEQGIDMNELDALLDDVLVLDQIEQGPSALNENIMPPVQEPSSSAEQVQPNESTEPDALILPPNLIDQARNAEANKSAAALNAVLNTDGSHGAQDGHGADAATTLDDILPQSALWQQLLQRLKTESKDAQALAASLQERLSAAENALKPMQDDVKRLDAGFANLELTAGSSADLTDVHEKLAGLTAAQENFAGFAQIQEKLAALETGIAALREKSTDTPSSVSSLEEKAADLAQTLQSLHTHMQPLVEGFADVKEASNTSLTRIEALEGRILSMEQRLNNMDASFDKRIASAAAKVIREEITQLATAFADE